MFEMGAKFKDGWEVKKEDTKKVSKELLSPAKHKLHFAKQKRKGKVVTIVQPFYLEKKELQALLKRLKKSLATGGSIQDESLELQGDIFERLQVALQKEGFGLK